MTIPNSKPIVMLKTSTKTCSERVRTEGPDVASTAVVVEGVGK